MTKLKAAMLQSHVYSDKAENIRALCVNLEELAKEKPDLVTLPEMFNCPIRAAISLSMPKRKEKKPGRLFPPWQQNMEFTFQRDLFRRQTNRAYL